MSNNMKIAVFSAQPYDREYLDKATASFNNPSLNLELIYHVFHLSQETALLASGCNAVSVFVNDILDAPVLQTLHNLGIKAILLRCAGFNHVDLDAARRLGLFVARVSAYAPEAVAEFTIALIMTLNRRTHRAYSRVREGNFSLVGLVGFTMHGKTVGLLGTGKIGVATARILKGFGCKVLAYDPMPSAEFTEEKLGEYVGLDELLGESDVVSLHCPLLESTRHIINADTLGRMKPKAMLVNTSRGGLIDTGAVIAALKSRKLGSLALDVYEEESALFYHDRSGDIIDDDVFQRLMTFPNVIVSGHQGFFTEEALKEISEATLRNVVHFLEGTTGPNVLVGRQ